MSDNACVAAIALAIAMAIGFMASCEKNKNTLDAEIQKVRIEKGLQK